MQLPIYDAIKNLPRLDAVPGYTQYAHRIQAGTVKPCRNMAQTMKGQTLTKPL